MHSASTGVQVLVNRTPIPALSVWDTKRACYVPSYKSDSIVLDAVSITFQKLYLHTCLNKLDSFIPNLSFPLATLMMLALIFHICNIYCSKQNLLGARKHSLWFYPAFIMDIS
jgi:hypothetical protein